MDGNLVSKLFFLFFPLSVLTYPHTLPALHSPTHTLAHLCTMTHITLQLPCRSVLLVEAVIHSVVAWSITFRAFGLQSAMTTLVLQMGTLCATNLGMEMQQAHPNLVQGMEALPLMTWIAQAMRFHSCFAPTLGTFSTTVAIMKM